MDIEEEIMTFVITKPVHREGEHKNLVTVAKTHATESPLQLKSESRNIIIINPLQQLHSLDGDLETDTKPHNINPLMQVESSNQDIETDEVKPYIITPLVESKSALRNGGKYDNSYSTDSLAQVQSENGNIIITNPLIQMHNLDGDLKTDAKYLTKVQRIDQDIDAEDVKPYMAKCLQSKRALWNLEVNVKPCSTESLAQLQSEHGNITITNPLVQLHSSDEDFNTHTKPLARVYSSREDIKVKDIKPYITESLVQAKTAFWNHDIHVKPYTIGFPAQFQSENWDISKLNPIVQLYRLDGDMKTTNPYSFKPQIQVQNLDIDAEAVKPCPMKTLVGCVEEMALLVPKLDPNPQCQSEIIRNEIVWETLSSGYKSMNSTLVCVPTENVLTEDSLERSRLECESLDATNNVFNFQSLQQNVNSSVSCFDNTKYNPLQHLQREKYTCNEFGQTVVNNKHSSCHTSKNNNSSDKCKMIVCKRNCSKHLLNHSGQEKDSCDCCGKSVTQTGHLATNVLLVHSGEKKYSCGDCGKSFTNRSHLTRHILNHSGEKKYSCNECGKKFTLRQSLTRHLLIHSGEKEYSSCNECGKSFTRKCSLIKHLLIHSGEKKYVCDECGKKFTQRNGLNAHLLIHSEEKKYSCDECGKKFAQKNTLTTHLLIHSEEKKFSCDECGKKFTIRQSLTRHLLIHSGGKEHISCNECGKSFIRKCALITHLLIHSGEKKYSCDECGKKFAQKNTLTTHLLIHSEEKKFSCDECGKKFTLRQSLTTHLLIHSGEKKYSCDGCGKKFAQKHNLNGHLLTHSGEKKHSCNECGKSFTQRSHLTTHLLIHSEEKKYSCDECGNSFTQRSHLNRHLLMHSGEKNYSCDECGKSFAQRGHLTTHLLIHSGEKKYSCDECGKWFYQRSGLIYHLSTHSKEKK